VDENENKKETREKLFSVKKKIDKLFI